MEVLKEKRAILATSLSLIWVRHGYAITSEYVRRSGGKQAAYISPGGIESVLGRCLSVLLVGRELVRDMSREGSIC